VTLTRWRRTPPKRGINLIFKSDAVTASSKITLDLKNVSLADALKHISEHSQTKYQIEPYAVVVLPLSDSSTALYTRTFTVPPGFVPETASETATPDQGARPTALDVLRSSGPNFPDGPSASYVPATNQLIVRNTEAELERIEALIDKEWDKYEERNRVAPKSKSGK
jgi:general secretion pathway protein D